MGVQFFCVIPYIWQGNAVMTD